MIAILTDPRENLRRLALLARSVRFVWDSARGLTVASCCLLAVQGLLPLASLYLMKKVVDAVTLGTAAADKEAAFKMALIYVTLLGAVTLLTALLNSIASLVSETQGQAVSDYMQSIIHRKSVLLDLAYYENADYYNTLHRAQQDALYRPASIVKGLGQIGQSSVAMLSLAALLASLHWAAAVVLVLASVPGALVRLKYSTELFRWQSRRTLTERMTWYLHSLITGQQTAKEIRQYRLGDLLIGRFKDTRRLLRRERFNLGRRRALIDLAAQTGTAMAALAVYAVIAWRTVQGALTMGDLVMYYQAFQRGQGHLREMLGALAGLYEDTLFLSNLYAFLDITAAVTTPPVPVHPPMPMRSGIVFDRVSFQYPGSSRTALHSMSLAISPGQQIALAGHNGSGKTTLVKLLNRFYDPTAGAITLDGTDFRDIDPAELQQRVSVIFQDYGRYHLSVRENIWFGNIDRPLTDGRVAAAARAAGADTFINGLPQQYDTLLGKQFGDGEELSAGEWQKIAIARAFMRDADIIILDEPTSSLDAQAEQDVFEQFRRLARGRTVVYISHRLANIRHVDCIYFFNNGRVIEQGPHDELMKRDGSYARLFRMQAKNYA